MTYVYSSGNPPSFYIEAGEDLVEGDLVKISSGTAVKVTAASDVPIGVVLEGANSGDQVEIAIEGVVNVRSKGSVTYAFGDKVYVDDGVDGAVSKTSSSAINVGKYVGKDLTTSANGDLIPVYISFVDKEQTG